MSEVAAKVLSPGAWRGKCRRMLGSEVTPDPSRALTQDFPRHKAPETGCVSGLKLFLGTGSHLLTLRLVKTKPDRRHGAGQRPPFL